MSTYIVAKVAQAALIIIGVFSPERKQHGQRVLFLSGLSAACVKEGVLEYDTVLTLNRSLSVANNQRSLGIGAQLSGEFWPNDCISKIMSPVLKDVIGEGVRSYPTITEARMAADKVLKNTPAWLHYNANEMKLDILDLLCDSRINYS